MPWHERTKKVDRLKRPRKCFGGALSSKIRGLCVNGIALAPEVTFCEKQSPRSVRYPLFDN